MSKVFGVFIGLVFPLLAATTSAHAQNFSGVQPDPIGKVTESPNQLKIQFPATMENKEAFAVRCLPAIEGFGSWADNNKIWTYNFKSESQYRAARLAGGGKCDIRQTADLKSADGKTWKAGTINYSVIVAGPNVSSVEVATGFNGELRESEPVLMVIFDGPVDAAKFFSQQNAYLSYLSASAPGEKIPLTAVPADQTEKIFNFFKSRSYLEQELADKNWVLVTTNRKLIPGAEVALTVQGQTSLVNPAVKADDKYTSKYKVRSNFQAEIQCASPSQNGATCLPGSPVTVAFNGKVKWTDVKNTYIEYVPYKADNNTPVRSYPSLREDEEPNIFGRVIHALVNTFPSLARFSDTYVESVEFDVQIEPTTLAKVVLPGGLIDIDARPLSNAINEFHIRIGEMTEEIRVPQAISIMEREVLNLSLPIGVVNLHQKINIRKSGSDSAVWAPIKDIAQIVKMIRAYSVRGEYRNQVAYQSPLDQLGVVNNVSEVQMTGVKNRDTYLEIPIGQVGAKADSGFYAIEVSSPSLEKKNSEEENYYNPKYVLAQVTNLAISMKKGRNETVLWVTHLNNATPVAGAAVEIYGCNGQSIEALTTNASGLARISNEKLPKTCDTESADEYSQYSASESFYVVAREAQDFAITHSSWMSSNSYAYMSKGVEYVYSDIVEEKPHFHAIVGVNLVKPGQTVPVQLIAKLPKNKGFADVPADKLPTTVRVANNEDSDVYYDFPLAWTNGQAEFTWKVPVGSSAKLGSYSLNLVGKDGNATDSISSGSIEVAEFKVPLMSGNLSFPKTELVQPQSIPVGTAVRYANGVGAKNLGLELSYYFEPTSVSVEDLEGFSFGTGAVTLTDEETGTSNSVLPRHSRPTRIEGLKTDASGSATVDIAKENVIDGRSIAEVMKELNRPQTLVVRARYQDQMGEYQTLSQSKTVYNSADYVGTKVSAGKREEARLQAAAVTVDNKNITVLSELDIKVVRVESKVIGEQLYGGLIKNTIERELKPVRWTGNCALVEKVASCEVGALQAGSYAFEVTSKVSKQTAHTLFKVDTEGRVYSNGDYYYFGDEGEERQLALGLNKESYKNGETAVASFPAPFKACTALVTIERSDVISAAVVTDACAKGHVDIPVNAELAPNAYVSVYAITGRASEGQLGQKDLGRPTYKLGFANMKVDQARYKSTVAVKTNKQQYDPGETVEVEVAVTPEEGQLTDGTVTLVAIEEKILELKPNDTYKVLEALMQQRGHNVETITPLEMIETATAGDEKRAAAPRKGGDEGGGGGAEGEFSRKLFDALVSFQPGVVVQNGVAKFSFKSNDSVTRFKVLAIAMDANQKFGTGEAVYLTQKDVQSSSNIPPVAHAGDAYPVRVNVQNNSGKDATYTAEVAVVIKDQNGNVIGRKNLKTSEKIGNTQAVSVAVGEFEVPEDAASIEYAVRVVDENGKLVDAMTPPAQKILPSVPMTLQSAFIMPVEKGRFSQSFEKPVEALPKQGEVRVSLAKSVVSGALAQIKARFEKDNYKSIFTQSRLYSLLQAGGTPEEMASLFDTLMSQTDSKGFVKYYAQSPRGDLALTASVINALSEEPWALKQVPAALLAKWKSAVEQVVTKSVDPVYVGKTPMDWVRAQSVMGRAATAFGDASLQSAAIAASKTITAELKRNPKAFGVEIAKWETGDLLDLWLMQVYLEPTTAGASEVAKQITRPSRINYAGNTAVLLGKPRFSSYYGDETIDSAKLLLGTSRLKGDKNLARGLALGLANSSRKSWYVSSTLSAVSQGLKSFARAYESVAVSGTALIGIPEENASMAIDFAAPAASSELVSAWTQNKATVQVTHAGRGEPWVSVQTLAAVPLKAARGQGFSVEKEVKNMTRDSGYQAGDIIEVTLKINAAASVAHVGLQDPIPAGSNILGEAYGSISSGEKSYSGYKFYFNVLPLGLSTVKYQYQLNNPGTFKMPPTRVEGLYMPGIYGEAPNATLTVR